jgi:Tfp pilus assembly protein PilF
MMPRLGIAGLRSGFILAVLLMLAASGCVNYGGTRSGGAVSKESRLAAHLKMGAAYLEVGDYNSALSELSKAELLEPNNVEVNSYLGLTYYGKAEYALAIERYKKVLQLDPRKTDIHNNLGLIYLRLKDYAQARTEFETCIKEPTYAQVHLAQFNLGLLEESEGHPDKAEAIYRQVINSNQMPSAYFRLGQLAINRQDYRAAVDYLMPAVRIDAKYTDAYFALAESYEALGMKDEAAEAYGQVVVLSPNTSRAIESQSRVRRLLGFQ